MNSDMQARYGFHLIHSIFATIAQGMGSTPHTRSRSFSLWSKKVNDDILIIAPVENNNTLHPLERRDAVAYVESETGILNDGQLSWEAGRHEVGNHTVNVDIQIEGNKICGFKIYIPSKHRCSIHVQI